MYTLNYFFTSHWNWQHAEGKCVCKLLILRELPTLAVYRRWIYSFGNRSTKRPKSLQFLKTILGEGQLYSHGRRGFMSELLLLLYWATAHTRSEPCSQLTYWYLLIIYNAHCYCVTLFLVLSNVPWHGKAVFVKNPQILIRRYSVCCENSVPKTEGVGGCFFWACRSYKADWVGFLRMQMIACEQDPLVQK